MDTVEIVKITDLLRRGRPLTAASSLPSSSSSSSSLLIGTVTLPTLTLKLLTNSFFQFSDDSSTICCDILCFDARILGKKILVLAWNFIPLKHSGGFLDIIRWSFSNSSVPTALSRCSNVDSIPLALPSVSSDEDASKTRYQVLGTLESISPISVIPCSTGASNSNVPQNLPRFHCELWLASVDYKKLITIGKEDSQLMYETMENSVLHLPRLLKKEPSLTRTAMNGKGESDMYTGVVKGVHMQGMVVELDKDVWLLLTDQVLTPPHSARVGAVISARNVHFVNLKFSWAKVLILGACFKTSVTIESFSPLESGYSFLYLSLS
ncbi:CST complex subunit CTC1 [Tripterygium wilfordii]|uniref:CST complex subunit CTC1 n=1 Tax=Tripterygium wilfordii TaxID=458696 RepID=UPI0018F84345|nr:CST complex subunit CTC1 [Tripterygium wilfordii]